MAIRLRLYRLVRRYGFVVAFVLCAGLFAAILTSSERSFVLQAKTYGAEIEFSGSQTKLWELPPQTRFTCDSRHTQCPQGSEFSTIVEWRDGTRIFLRPGRDGGLDLLLRSSSPAASGRSVLATRVNGVALEEGMIISVPRQEWIGMVGNLTFSGYLRIGAEPSSGLRDHLLEGEFEARDLLRFRSRPSTVLSGNFFPGDEVTINGSKRGLLKRFLGGGDSERVGVTGFVSSPPQDASGARWFQIAAYSWSWPGAYLEVRRLGAGPARIAPQWAHRAIEDPFVLGLAALLAIAAGLAQVASTIKDFWQRQ